MQLETLITHKKVTKKARQRFDQFYPTYKDKIEYHVNTFPQLHNYDREDIRSFVVQCLLLACIIWDENRGSFSTIFWSLVHRFLDSLKHADSAQKRSSKVPCKQCTKVGMSKGAGKILKDSLSTIVSIHREEITCFRCQGSGYEPEERLVVRMETMSEEYFSFQAHEGVEENIITTLDMFKRLWHS